MNRKLTVILTAVVLLLGVVGTAGAQGVTPQTLLPGALIPNRSLRFICRVADVRVETSLSPLTDGLTAGEVLQVPVKHGEGQFVAGAEDLARIEGEGLVAFRYCAPDGTVDDEHNVNGAANAIAGVRSEAGNVVGLMPHREHAVDPDVGPTTRSSPPIPRPCARPFCGRARRRVSKTGTVELQGNTYAVDPGLAWPGAFIDVRFDPFDLSRLDVYRDGQPLAPVTVVHYKRQFHLKVESLVPPQLRTDAAAGSDFLAHLRDEHDAALRKQIGTIQFSNFTQD